MPFTKPYKTPKIGVPLERCYWVVENLLLAGAYPGHPNGHAHTKRISGLWEAGMRTFINLMEEGETNHTGQAFGLRSQLKIGLQWGTQVTLDGCKHLVTQAYCSALPVDYSGLSSQLWERFARLILGAAYEATLAAAVLNASKTGNKSVYLTLIGGGVFGNDQEWILDAIRRAAKLYSRVNLDVKIVSFLNSNSNSAIRKLCKEL